MSISLSSLRSFVAEHRLRSEVVGVSLLALAIFVVIGARARHALQPARAGLHELRAAASEVATFRSAFRPAPEQDLRVAAMLDSLDVAIARGGRTRTALRLAATAESLGLRAVNVRFASAGATPALAVPDLIRSHVDVADYALALSCRGDFAAVLSLINRLPASVALQHVSGVRENEATRYDVILAVFESRASNVAPDGPRG